MIRIKKEGKRFVYQKTIKRTFNTVFYYKITFANSKTPTQNSKGYFVHKTGVNADLKDFCIKV